MCAGFLMRVGAVCYRPPPEPSSPCFFFFFLLDCWALAGAPRLAAGAVRTVFAFCGRCEADCRGSLRGGDLFVVLAGLFRLR